MRYFPALDRGDHTDSGSYRRPVGWEHVPPFSVLQRDREGPDRGSPGSFARLAAAVGETGASLGAIDLVSAERRTKVRDVTVLAADATHLATVVEAMRAVDGTEVCAPCPTARSCCTLAERSKRAAASASATRDDLSLVYTPGVARICRAIADDPDRVWRLTIRQNSVAVVTDGSAVLGLGNIGPEAALPVMEGKALLFADFAGSPRSRCAWRRRILMRSCAQSRTSPRSSAASTSRTSPRRTVSSSSASASGWTSRCSTTISTARRSSSSRAWSTPSASSARDWRTSGS